ncbi:response regulator [bacterium]|nr:response regulator [bacterium]
MSRFKVMIVDDEPIVLICLKRLCDDQDYDLVTFSNAKAALEYLESHEVAVIISDQKMPEMDGNEFFRKTLDIQGDAVRIMLTGYAQSSGIIEAINSSKVDSFFLKPWNEDDLKATINEAYEAFKAKRKCLDQLEVLCL